MATESKPSYPTEPKLGLKGRESLFDQRLNEWRVSGQIEKPKWAKIKKSNTADFETPNIDSKVLVDISDLSDIERVIFIDPGLGVLNFRTIGKKVDKELERSKRYKRPLGFIAVGLDRADKLVQALSPLAFPTLQKIFARIVSQNTRDVDSVGMLSENQLLILCPETSAKYLRDQAERIRNVVSGSRFGELGHNIIITASIAIAVFSDENAKFENIQPKLIQALQEAEKQGGNRIVAVTDYVSEIAKSIQNNAESINYDFSPETNVEASLNTEELSKAKEKSSIDPNTASDMPNITIRKPGFGPKGTVEIDWSKVTLENSI